MVQVFFHKKKMKAEYGGCVYATHINRNDVECIDEAAVGSEQMKIKDLENLYFCSLALAS